MSLATRALTIASLGSAVVAGSLLHPVVSGQVKHTTHMGGPIGQGLLPSAGAFVVLALLLGLVAYHEHIPSVNRVVSSRTTKRFGTIVLVGAVVSAAALSGVGGPASPVETVQAGYFEGCEFSDSLTFSIGASLGLSDQDCAFYTPDQNADEISATDAYANALVANETKDSFITSQQNFGNDMRSVAWAKAKISIVNDLNNNVSEANATANAKEVVNQYYYTNMKNILRDYDARATQAAYLADATTDTDRSTQVVLRYDGTTSQPVGVNTTTWTYTFPDNSTLNITSTKSYQDLNSRWGYHVVRIVRDGYTTEMEGGADYTPDDWDMNVKSNESSDETTLYNLDTYSALLENRDVQRTQVNANVDTYVNETYQAYQAGEINATDLANADPQTIGTQAATDYNSTGYYGLANSQLAALGLSGNETVSHVVNTTDNGSARTITGTVFYTGEDSQSFATGTEYDPTALNGSVYMSVASIEDGTGTELNHSAGFYQVDENFTVTSATDTKTGESVNTTTMETRNYTSTNVSLLQEEIDRLQEQRAFYEQQAASSGGGISLDFGGVETGVILALLFVAFLATRD